jgi:hypothetical protein
LPPAQVGDAGAPDPAEAGERRAVRDLLDETMEAVPAALERRAVMRRPEEDEVPEETRPATAGERAVVDCAACHEAAQAVSEDRHFVDGHGPRSEERVEHPGELSPVRRDVPAGVVVHVDRRVAERARERGGVVVSRPRPLEVVHAEPWTRTSIFPPAAGSALASAPRSSTSGRPCTRKRIAIASGFSVAARWSPTTPFSAARNAARRGVESGATAGASRASARSMPPPVAARHAVDRPVDEPGGRVHRDADRPAERRRDARDRGLHLLDDPGHPGGGVEGEPDGAAEVAHSAGVALGVSADSAPAPLAQVRVDEGVEVAVEDRVRVPHLGVRAVVLHHAVGWRT